MLNLGQELDWWNSSKDALKCSNRKCKCWRIFRILELFQRPKWFKIRNGNLDLHDINFKF